MNGTPEHRVRMHELATGLKQAGFPQWLLRIDLSDVWKNPAMSFGERRDVVTARLRGSSWYAGRVQDAGEGRPDVLAMMVEELGDALDADAFNCAWDEICDMADADRVWLNLHGVPEGSAAPRTGHQDDGKPVARGKPQRDRAGERGRAACRAAARPGGMPAMRRAKRGRRAAGDAASVARHVLPRRDAGESTRPGRVGVQVLRLRGGR